MGLSGILQISAKNTLSLRRAVRLVWDSSRTWTLANFAILVIQGLLPLASLYVLKLILDAVSAALAAPDKSAAFQQVVVTVMLAGGVSLVTDVVGTLGGLVTFCAGAVSR